MWLGNSSSNAAFPILCLTLKALFYARRAWSYWVSGAGVSTFGNFEPNLVGIFYRGMLGIEVPCHFCLREFDGLRRFLTDAAMRLYEVIR